MNSLNNEFWYKAKYPESPKHAIEVCITKKKGISKDKIRKLLGFFATTRLVQDWKAAEPNKVLLKDCTWDLFLKKTLIILQTKEKSYNMKSRIQAISSSQKLNF